MLKSWIMRGRYDAGARLAELNLNPVMTGADAAAAGDWLMITR